MRNNKLPTDTTLSLRVLVVILRGKRMRTYRRYLMPTTCTTVYAGKRSRNPRLVDSIERGMRRYFKEFAEFVKCHVWRLPGRTGLKYTGHGRLGPLWLQSIP